MSDFLDSLPFLTPEQRAKVREADLDVAAAVVVLTPADIATHTGLTIGKAGLLLAAAKAEVTAASAATATTTDADREYQARRARIELALQALRSDPAPHRRRAVRDLGVEFVVRDAGEKVNPAATLDMLTDIENGAPVPQSWQGEQVVAVRDIGIPTVYCHPRTGVVLQGGVDDKTGVSWKDLELAGMRLAAYAYREGMVHGMSDRQVFEGIRGDVGGLRSGIETRVKNLKVNLPELDADILYRAPHTRERPGYQDPAPAPPASPLRNGSGTRLSALLLKMFSGDEIRRFLRYMPGGDSMTAEMPGPTASAASVAAAMVDVLTRHGRIDRDLRDRLVAERPRWADQIDTALAA